MCVRQSLSHIQLCNPMDCSPPCSSVHGIFQLRILKWVSTFYSGGSSQPKDRTHISCSSCIGRQILYHSATWEAIYKYIYIYICMKMNIYCVC